MSHYGVPLIRVPETKLRPHKDSCSLSDLKSYVRRVKRPIALDLFCGAGGLSLGLQEAGFDVILGIDRYIHAIATHRAHFGGASLCRNLSARKFLKDIAKALKGVPVTLVAGGPPCQPFSRAGKNKIRSLKRKDSADSRRDLWRSFIYLVRKIKPEAILLENVPDLAFGENSVVFRKIVDALEESGYGIDSRILSAWHFGVPQHRRRLIIVGMRDGLSFKWPRTRVNKKVTVKDAICDLPAVSGGAGQIELPYDGPVSPFQRSSRRGLHREDKKKIFDHLTRPVRDDDLEAFRLMKHGTLYSELPAHLRRYRSDIFDDKYKRLPWDSLSRSITAHIGRDGYWYIHPEQHRTLTVREAARIQTFPDRFRFAGTPSHAFRQIGEAVPPLLAKVLGRKIRSALESSEQEYARPSTRVISRTLRDWFKKIPAEDLLAPWRRNKDIWQILLGMTLWGGRKDDKTQAVWGLCMTSWSTPRRFLNDRKRTSKLRKYSCHDKNRPLSILARRLLNAKGDLGLVTEPENIAGISPGSLKVACAIAGLNSRRPVTGLAARVAERIFGESFHGSTTHAELTIGRVVGVDESGHVYAALLEVGERFCRITQANCRECPLQRFCHYARTKSNRDGLQL